MENPLKRCIFTKMKTGKLIGAFGMPGVGKSSVTRELGRLLNIPTFHEPEEESWPDAVMMRGISGQFTSIMWFRAMRAPMLYRAQQLTLEGQSAMVDSYYDKLFTLFFDKPGLQWLIDDRDPYWAELKVIADKDLKLLPNLDILIYFEVDFDTWIQFLKLRNRNLDNESLFRESFNTQEYFLQAAEQYCAQSGCHLVRAQQRLSSPLEIAEGLLPEIEALITG